MSEASSQVIGVIELCGTAVPADLRPLRRAPLDRGGTAAWRGRGAAADCQVVRADLRQLRRDLRREWAALHKRILAAKA